MANSIEVKKSNLICWVLFASLSMALLVHLLVWFIFPNVRFVSESDAISIANTYMVFTTLLVTVFAVFVALITFFSAKESTESKFLKLQNDFEEHLQNDDKFSKRMKKIAENHVNEQLNTVDKESTFEILIQTLMKAASTRMKSSMEVGDVLGEVRKDHGSPSDRG